MQSMGKKRWFYLASCVLVASSASARRPDGVLELQVVEASTEDPVPARLELHDARGRLARGTEPFGAAPLGGQVYLDGESTLPLRRGAYTFTLDAGPEYRTQHGRFEIDRHADDSKRVEMHRAADLASEGWIGADLASCRPTEDYPLLHRAEQLGYTPKIVAAWDGESWAEPKLKERRRRDRETVGASALWTNERGVVWLIDPDNSRSIQQLPTPGKSSLEMLGRARSGGWKVVAAIASRELPLWIAHELIDAVVVVDGWANTTGKTLGLRMPDKLRYPGPQGAGRWRRDLYESLIDAGVRVPPAALSGSGLNTEVIGSSRTYAYTGGRLGSDRWWQAAEQMAVVVGNGPLLRPFVAGAPPGESFLLAPGSKRTLSIALNLATRRKIEYLEIIQNGVVVRTVRIAELAAAGGRLPEIEFDSPGWMLVAAIAENPDRYELAISAPWFVDGPTPRIDPEDAQAWQAALAQARDAFGDSDPDAYQAAERWWAAKR